MATNRELLAKLNDKLEVVSNLIGDLAYEPCTKEDRESLHDCFEVLREQVEQVSQVLDNMDGVLQDVEEKGEDDRSASEDDSDKE